MVLQHALNCANGNKGLADIFFLNNDNKIFGFNLTDFCVNIQRLHVTCAVIVPQVNAPNRKGMKIPGTHLGGI